MQAIKTVTSTNIQNNFGQYLNYVVEGQEIAITKNGKRIARLIPENYVPKFLTDSLTGILDKNLNLESEKNKQLKGKYEIAD